MGPGQQPLSPGHAAFLKARNARIDGLRDWFQENYPDPADIVLEIGCGHGHYLAAYAGLHPHQACLGIDLVTKRVEKARRKRDQRGLHNLQFLKAEVVECLEAWPERLAVQRILVLFPDPWPKKRHAKNRILQTSLLSALARHARRGAPLHFRTDDEGNFAWGMDVIAAHPDWAIDDAATWPLENPSFFQDLFEKYFSLTARCTGGHRV
ncbi:MAG: tRNA (guanine(46)-N(7))-methyltransferase TrmB [Oceanipulchritudo sp.]